MACPAGQCGPQDMGVAQAMIRFAALGSGSSGNALLVEAGNTRLLIDCGFTLQEATKRLRKLDLEPNDLDALLITHEHKDHIGACAAFARRHHVPVRMTPGTFLGARDRAFPHLHEFHAGAPFEIRDLEIRPFTVPHDAREPVQFVLSDGARSLALLTDAGHISTHIIDCLAHVDALLIECNHDPGMLAMGPYPPALKRRVGGRYGHLSNHQAETLLRAIDRSRLQHVIGMHLSQSNNHPELARKALADGLDCSPSEVSIADQCDGFGWRELR